MIADVVLTVRAAADAITAARLEAGIVELADMHAQPAALVVGKPEANSGKTLGDRLRWYVPLRTA
jgi:hypothetical protein